MNDITFEEAKAILNSCTREELRDHAFGDREVYWMRGEEEIGFSYVCAGPDIVGVKLDGHEGTFEGREARELLGCGSSVRIERNDSTGPDRYQDGACMPGLTLEGVRKELTGS